MCATMTDHTSNTIKEHIEQTLRMRLGTTRKMVTGQELHDAVVALGLTRYSQSDVNAVVNKLAAFVRLRFETTDKKPPTRMQHSGTLSRMIGLQHMTTGATQSLEVTVDERSKAIWEWPHDGVASMADFLRGNVSEGNPSAQHNVVPFQALAMAFAMEGDGKRIFGNSAELFRAIKEISANHCIYFWVYTEKGVPVGFCIVSCAREEILLAGDTNRLVAELTFVRINDLAAPTPPVDPVLYIEPFVALLIVSNEARQCSVCFALPYCCLTRLIW